ncbi:GTA-gp10 family protein [Woodsholea maritima]|uniref:GTA-gp10 family protein n=1 Tax=Woodsholea maritima TaxID=240237 RepID=UPI00036A5A5C|nr:GTA-gp10 family protein [Woodsholea maritima]
MTSPFGEGELRIAGEIYPLRLSLGALARIEADLGLDHIADLGTRLAQPRAGDLVIILRHVMRAADPQAPDPAQLDFDLPAVIAALTGVFAATKPRS